MDLHRPESPGIIDGMSSQPPAVVVVGSVNEDLVFDGVSRLPAPGETVHATHVERLPGGKGGNQAVACRGLGVRTLLVGAVGDDEPGRAALDDLDRSGVERQFVRTRALPTGVAAVAVDTRGENFILVAPGANALVDAADAAAVAEAVVGHRVVLLASLEVPQAVVAQWAAQAKARGWTVVVNPAPVPDGGLADALLRCVDVLTPNVPELEALGGSPGQLFDRGVGAVVVTRGRGGAEVHLPGRPVARQPAFPVDAVDTTGAGDAFSGALAAQLARGLDLVDAVRAAAAVGALATRAPGARSALPDGDELERVLAQGLVP